MERVIKAVIHTREPLWLLCYWWSHELLTAKAIAAMNGSVVSSLTILATTMNGVHAVCSLGDADRVFVSTVLLSNPVIKVRITDNAACGRQTDETSKEMMESKAIMESMLIAA